ncbi:DUF1802 family protein [Tautonia sociabilis]|uniref:DUF1802 family protein n=1 Tax=Tautonia sociabilis TaxID=2080755 RepID=UPI0013150ED4|nr:DUF1802 family protein [Tautonia sociabilis]
MTAEQPIPPPCPIAFKEWAGVCSALADGRQSLILRKGGIDESAGEFRPEHPAFWLYPTHLHEAQQGLRDSSVPEPIPDEPGMIPLPALAVVEEVAWVDRDEVLEGLADQHVWTEETVRKRFHYKRPGLWVLGVRVWRAEPPPRVAITPEHAGCKSWVPLEEPPPMTGLVPTLDPATLASRMARIRAIAAPEAP